MRSSESVLTGNRSQDFTCASAHKKNSLGLDRKDAASQGPLWRRQSFINALCWRPKQLQVPHLAHYWHTGYCKLLLLKLVKVKYWINISSWLIAITANHLLGTSEQKQQNSSMPLRTGTRPGWRKIPGLWVVFKYVGSTRAKREDWKIRFRRAEASYL